MPKIVNVARKFSLSQLSQLPTLYALITVHVFTAGGSSAPAIIRGVPGHTVTLDEFTGPLDLLLHLVRTAEMDIFNLDVARITEDYLRIVEDEGVRDLAAAYHFLALAATLVELKSRLLLPRHAAGAEEAEAAEEDDPRLDLARKLAAYEGIQSITAELGQRFEHVSAHWPRQVVAQLQAEILYSLDSLSVYDLMSAFADVASRPHFTQITIFKEDFDVDEARSWLRRRLTAGPAELTALLLEQHDIFALLVTFIALLELIKEEELSFTREGGRIVILPTPAGELL